jgi:hypothetical protein
MPDVPGEGALDDEVVHGLHRLIAQSTAWIVLQPVSCKAINCPASVQTSEPLKRVSLVVAPKIST